jgi:hypothetical protein
MITDSLFITGKIFVLFENVSREHTSDLTIRGNQPLHRVQPQFYMTNTHSFQASPAAINGG